MTLPDRPINICSLAWEGVFAVQFGLWHEPLKAAHRENDGAQHWTGGYAYTVSSAIWSECAYSGCLWCRFLEKHFLEELASRSSHWPIPGSDEIVTVRVGADHRSVIKPLGLFSGLLSIVVQYREDLHKKEFEVFTYAGMSRRWAKELIVRLLTPRGNCYVPDDPAAACIDGPLPIPRVNTPLIFAMAKTWMEECARDHEVCRRAETLDSAHWLPTRLVDCSDPRHVRIIETNDRMHGARYVTLSYVWGAGVSQAHRTTTANLSTYTRTGIATTSLPRTIRDAIYVARTLGFHLLWLDSLCIVQDSPEDKHREVASMCNVYRHAYLTIDAASAAGVDEGFLLDRPILLAPDMLLPFICPGCPEVTQEPRTGKACFLTTAEMEDVAERRLVPFLKRNETSLRGWCLQEALLSTRSLVFDETTLSLRCQTAQRHVGLRENERQSLLALYDAVPLTDPGTAVLAGSDEWTKVRSKWHAIVKDYSGRSLSYRSDKLLACAAIAEVFAPHLGPGYVAGLWRSTLVADLLWESMDRHSGRRRPQEYPIAPSWSWASTNHPMRAVVTPLSRLQYMAEVVECNVALQDKNLPFGPIHQGGHLVLHAVLLPYITDGHVEESEFNAKVIIDLERVRDVLIGAAHALSEPAVPGSGKMELHIICDYDDDDHDEGLRGVFFVPLMATEHQADEELTDPGWIYGLLVARTEWSVRQSARFTDRGEVYQRVGFWWACGIWADGPVTPECRARTDAFLRLCKDVSEVDIVLV